MASFPPLHTGSVAKYPVTRFHKYRTVIYTFVDLTEQRFSKGNGPLQDWDLVFNNVNTADKNTVEGFFTGTIGATDHTWDITFGDPDPSTPTTYTNMQFLPNQRFTATNISPDRWKFTLRVRQTRKT